MLTGSPGYCEHLGVVIVNLKNLFMTRDSKIDWYDVFYMIALLLSGYMPLAAVVQIPKDKINPSEDMIFWAAGIANFVLLLLLAFNQWPSRLLNGLVTVFVVITVFLSSWLLLGTIQQGKFNFENVFYFLLVIAPIVFGVRRLLKTFRFG